MFPCMSHSAQVGHDVNNEVQSIITEAVEGGKGESDLEVTWKEVFAAKVSQFNQSPIFPSAYVVKFEF